MTSQHGMRKPFYRDHSFWIQLCATITMVVSLMHALRVFERPTLDIAAAPVLVFPFAGCDPATGAVAEHIEPAFILPIAFINRGGRPTTVSKLTLAVKVGDTTYRYAPSQRVDFRQIFSRQEVKADCMRGPYMPFSVNPGETIEHAVMFCCPEPRRPTIAPRTHVLVVTAESHNGNTAIATMEFALSERQVGEFRSGIPFLINQDFRLGINPRTE